MILFNFSCMLPFVTQKNLGFVIPTCEIKKSGSS
jgi:hypothetical protein